MFELIRKNRNRSILFVGIMAVILIAVGWVAGEIIAPGAGMFGLVIAVALTIILFLVAYNAGSKVILSASGARKIKRADAPQLFNVVEEMTIASGLSKMPDIYIMESNVANAFATGKDPETAAVAVTEGLLNICNREELQGVMAHEIAHIKHRDIQFMTLLSVMAGAIAIISDIMMRHLFWTGGGRRSRSSNSNSGGSQAAIMLIGIALMIFGALLARVVYFAASRSREYLADAGGAIFTRNPIGLANALEKLSRKNRKGKLPVPKVAQAMLIVGPSLMATHPPIGKRIDILRKLAGAPSLSYAGYAQSYSSAMGSACGFMPASAVEEEGVTALDDDERAALQTPTDDEQGSSDFRREALDALKKNAGFEFRPCSCGATLKIPAEFPKGRAVKCPACGRKIA